MEKKTQNFRSVPTGSRHMRYAFCSTRGEELEEVSIHTTLNFVTFSPFFSLWENRLLSVPLSQRHNSRVMVTRRQLQRRARAAVHKLQPLRSGSARSKSTKRRVITRHSRAIETNVTPAYFVPIRHRLQVKKLCVQPGQASPRTCEMFVPIGRARTGFTGGGTQDGEHASCRRDRRRPAPLIEQDRSVVVE